ncbi:hypothetical protein MMC09_005798 [Bachmanniomyces sp. S44760]|nr:hypothetical protein [Bachmanniomyces sp. S44760]
MGEAHQLGQRQEMHDRSTLCFSGVTPGVTIHQGDKGFSDHLKQNFVAAESNALERVFSLKARLENVPVEDFWTAVLEGLSVITNSQFTFVSKRILVDDQRTAVEMPPFGEPGSCLMGVALYYNNGHDIYGHMRDYKYDAYTAGCGHMRHDKVLVIPHGLMDFVPTPQLGYLFPLEAYIGIPLFHEGKCFGHIGQIWTSKGLQERDLSWGFVEMTLHVFEDLIKERMLVGQSFVKVPEPANCVPKVIPQTAITAMQSLKPYARSLSHELRTPMQGVVGMLDIMYAAVQESLESQPDEKMRTVFETFRDNIEIVQDSSRRAVEAADNVVHAYDLNMQVPGTPEPQRDDEVPKTCAPIPVSRAPSSKAHADSPKQSPNLKRPRSASMSRRNGPKAKRILLESIESTTTHDVTPDTGPMGSVASSNGVMSSSCPIEDRRDDNCDATRNSSLMTATFDAIPGVLTEAMSQEQAATPGIRHSKIRKALRWIINEALRVGGRPDSAIAENTIDGELIEIRSTGPGGHASVKTVEWSVDSSVPEDILVDDRDLSKLISVMFLNAVKFTEHGRITVKVALSPNSRYIVITVTDTGSGIPAAFKPFLFQAFSREDDSLTRHTEGLGLGLLVAKGLARRIGGDLICVRSETEGPNRGSEFELRMPISPESTSRQGTPSRTPTPIGRSIDPSPLKEIADVRSSPRKQQSATRSNKDRTRTLDPLAATSANTTLRPSESRRNSLGPSPSRAKTGEANISAPRFDRHLAKKHPLTILVAEDNAINRKLLITMLSKLGYFVHYEAYDGAEAVRLMSVDRHKCSEPEVDVILMDLWMPNMDGYEATRRILAMDKYRDTSVSSSEDACFKNRRPPPMILAVTADITDRALERATESGMSGFMTKPYKLMDLERLLLEYCTQRPESFDTKKS